jgi:large repetitive protein
MNFGVANLRFNATSVSSLAIANGMATLTGTGTINGAGNYHFLVTGVNGGGIRVQITDSSNNVIYDTQPGAPMTATPTTPLVSSKVAVNG